MALALAVFICVVLGVVSIHPRDYGYYWAHSRAASVCLAVVYLFINAMIAFVGAAILGVANTPDNSVWLDGIAIAVTGQAVMRLDRSRLVLQQEKQTVESLVDPEEPAPTSGGTVVLTQGRTLFKALLKWLATALDEASGKSIERQYGLLAQQSSNDPLLAERAYNLYVAYIADDPAVDVRGEAVANRYLLDQLNKLYDVDTDGPNAMRARLAVKWFCIRTTVANRHY